jgi:hypothetical protein
MITIKFQKSVTTINDETGEIQTETYKSFFSKGAQFKELELVIEKNPSKEIDNNAERLLKKVLDLGYSVIDEMEDWRTDFDFRKKLALS